MAIAVDQNYDKAQRKISTANLEQFAGVDCQLLVEKETHRPIIMDGATVGGKFKCASTEELKAVETVANNAISQAYADGHYLGKTDKAVSAGTADTADSATKATQDASGNVITNTYATKTEVTEGLAGKLGKTEKATSASTADSVAWTGVTGKPTFATVATSGSYNDLKNKPSIPSSGMLFSTGSIIVVSGTLTSSTNSKVYRFTTKGICKLYFGASSDTGYTKIEISYDGTKIYSFNGSSSTKKTDIDCVLLVQKDKTITLTITGNSDRGNYALYISPIG